MCILDHGLQNGVDQRHASTASVVYRELSWQDVYLMWSRNYGTGGPGISQQTVGLRTQFKYYISLEGFPRIVNYDCYIHCNTNIYHSCFPIRFLLLKVITCNTGKKRTAWTFNAVHLKTFSWKRRQLATEALLSSSTYTCKRRVRIYIALCHCDSIARRELCDFSPIKAAVDGFPFAFTH